MSATHRMSIHRDHAAERPTLPDRFHVDVEPERDVVRVCPSGDVDLATVGDIRERVDELTTAGFRRVVIDLREVTFLDSTGLRLVLDLDAASRSDGWELAVIEGSAAVQRAFEVTGLRQHLPFIAAGQLRGSRWQAWP
jgi:anti-sigma B factor antagonist